MSAPKRNPSDSKEKSALVRIPRFPRSATCESADREVGIPKLPYAASSPTADSLRGRCVCVHPTSLKRTRRGGLPRPPVVAHRDYVGRPVGWLRGRAIRFVGGGVLDAPPWRICSYPTAILLRDFFLIAPKRNPSDSKEKSALARIQRATHGNSRTSWP